jgi:Lar family restriction alleviation protein
MEVDVELKPCPFCGGRAILTMMNDGKSLSGYAVACERTSIDCPTAMPATKFFASHDMAIREWNRRATDE